MLGFKHLFNYMWSQLNVHEPTVICEVGRYKDTCSKIIADEDWRKNNLNRSIAKYSALNIWTRSQLSIVEVQCLSEMLVSIDSIKNFNIGRSVWLPTLALLSLKYTPTKYITKLIIQRV